MIRLPSRIFGPIETDLLALKPNDSALFIGGRVTVTELNEGLEDGEIDMLCRIASLYIRGVLLPKKLTFAITMLEQILRIDGDGNVCNNIKTKFVLGQAYNVVSAYEKGYALFYDLAHKCNHGMSYTMLSVYYKYGRVVPKSTEMQKAHLKLGAETGDFQSKQSYAWFLIYESNFLSKCIGLIKFTVNFSRSFSIIFNGTYEGREFIASRRFGKQD